MSRDLENMDVQSMFDLLGKITEGDYSSKVGDPKRLVAAEIIQKLYEYTPWDVLEVYPVEGPWICSRLFPDPGGWFEAAAMGMSRADIIGKGKGKDKGDFMGKGKDKGDFMCKGKGKGKGSGGKGKGKGKEPRDEESSIGSSSSGGVGDGAPVSAAAAAIWHGLRNGKGKGGKDWVATMAAATVPPYDGVPEPYKMDEDKWVPLGHGPVPALVPLLDDRLSV